MLNQTHGLNRLSHNSLAEIFHLTIGLLFPGTWWLLEEKGISCMSQPHSCRSLCAWNLIIWVHLISVLEYYSCGVVVELIMLNAFMLIARVIILLLVCLIIIDLVYANASTVLEFIDEMLQDFFLIFLVRRLLWCLVALWRICGFQGVTVGIKA
jgi:hypothetical protein